MRIKFLTHCRDIATSEHYLEGEVADLPEDRALAAIAKGHAVRVTEPEPKPLREPTDLQPATAPKRKPGRPPKDKAMEPSEDK